MDEKTIEIGVDKLQKLLDNFYRVCSFCDEMDIYENEELDESMQRMHEWVESNFGRKIN
jgi:hypothetical protein